MQSIALYIECVWRVWLLIRFDIRFRVRFELIYGRVELKGDTFENAVRPVQNISITQTCYSEIWFNKYFPLDFSNDQKNRKKQIGDLVNVATHMAGEWPNTKPFDWSVDIELRLY